MSDSRIGGRFFPVTPAARLLLAVAAFISIPCLADVSPSRADPQALQPVTSDTAATKAEKKAQKRPERPILPAVAVKLKPEAVARDVAARYGATVAFAISAMPGWYQFSFGSAADAEASIPAMQQDADIEQALLQRANRRVRKTNDTWYGNQWHLENTGQNGGTAGDDLNVNGAWTGGYTGTGVMISIVDDGVETAHPDLAAGYNSAYAYDYVDNDSDPNPAAAGDDHGTAVCGLAAARGQNSLGVAGVAYDANWTAVRLLGTGMSDSTEASALGQSLANVDIYNNSWGPADNGDYEEIGSLPKNAILNGVANGRGGKGAIYVWAGGNGYGSPYFDDSNLDAYANMPETIAAASIDKNFNNSTYSEGGANILVTAPGGESDVFTTDRSGASGYNDGSLFSDQDYTNDFDGTSAATPMVSGVVALMLDANPNLTWRDVQHILVYTADHSKIAGGTYTNGAGLIASDRWGFGVVDATAAAQLAAQWTNAPARQTVYSPTDNGNVPIPDNSTIGINRTVNVTNTLYIEHTVVEFTTNHTWWGDLRVTLISPSGTISHLALASGGYSPSGTTWYYMSTRNWGEQAQGNWTLKVSDEAAVDTGNLQSWRVIFYGTTTPPNQSASISNTALSDGTTGTGYYHQFQVSTISQQTTWSLSGNVPPGLVINSSNGILSGTPTTVGTYNFTVEATGTLPPSYATASVTLNVLMGTTPPPGGGSSGFGGGGGGGGGCTVGDRGVPAFLGLLALFALLALSRRRRA
ncbi:MAG: S8 family serine peptidase [Planctomycetes bacterium]|nr:S8 family serine peptidase [Planctomycetota bacterium]